MLRQTNILDPIQSKLDQTVFDGIDPRKRNIDLIKRLYYRALDKELGIPPSAISEWADLYLTGSLTTYQYSETSDADISVFPNYEEIWERLGLEPDQVRKELISMSIEHLDGTFLPGTTHPLQFFVVPYQTFPEDLYKSGLRSAYNILEGDWFVYPEKNRVHDVSTEMPDIWQKAVDTADKMNEMLDHDPEQAREMWHQLHQKRTLQQRAGEGDFSEGNIIYKYMLNHGIFDRLRNELNEYIARTAAYEETYPVLDSILSTTKDRNFDAAHDAVVSILTTYKGLSLSEAEQVYWAWRADREKNQNANDRYVQDFKQKQQEAWEQHNKEIEELDKKYGPEVNAIVNRFKAIEPEDAPPYEGGNNTVEYMLEDGWSWKFVADKNIGGRVWADAETHDYGGIYSHTEAMEDLRSSVQEDWIPERKDFPNLALGWVDKPALKDGNQPYKVLVRGGENISDEELLKLLTLTPQEAIVDREGVPMRFAKRAALPPDLPAIGTIWTMANPYDAKIPRFTVQIIDADDDEIWIRNLDSGQEDSLRTKLWHDWIKNGRIWQRKDQFKPPDNETIDAMWPNFIPWGENEQNYYRNSSTDHLWDDRVTTKVIYDFDKDQIILGTDADLTTLPGAKVLGDYKDGSVTLYEADKQWINPMYFHRLWAFSFPSRPLNDVYFKRGDKTVKLKTLPKGKKSGWKLGGNFDQFFEDASRGQYAPQKAYSPNYENPEHAAFHDTWRNYAGNFDTHIDSSIPGYRENQTAEGVAISAVFGTGATMLDLGGSEGSFAKAVTEHTNGAIQTHNLDPNAAMKEHFENTPTPEGAQFVQGYFGDNTGQKYDVVHESMLFQFIGPERDQHIAQAKQYLKPNGLFLTAEKVITDNFEENEKAKDEWKAQFYSPEQIQQKQDVVKVQHTSGMIDNMVHVDDFEMILHNNFASVEKYWESGNFVGYACSDDQRIVNAFVKAYSQNST